MEAGQSTSEKEACRRPSGARAAGELISYELGGRPQISWQIEVS